MKPYQSTSTARYLVSVIIGFVAALALAFSTAPAANASNGLSDCRYIDPSNVCNITPNVTAQVVSAGNYYQMYDAYFPSDGVISASFAFTSTHSNDHFSMAIENNEGRTLTHLDLDKKSTAWQNTPQVGVKAGKYHLHVWEDGKNIGYKIRFNYTKSSSWEDENRKFNLQDYQSWYQPLKLNTPINGTILDTLGDRYQVTVPRNGVLFLTFANEKRPHGSWNVSTGYDSYTFHANQSTHPSVALMNVKAGQTISIYVNPPQLISEFTSARYTLTVKLGFKDVNTHTPHASDIQWLADKKISTGYDDGTFGGMRTVVRQDMAAFLYRLAGSPSFNPASHRNPFRDVNSKTPHYKEILWLYYSGIAKGYGDGTFGGMRTVVRQDMAAFLHRYAQKFGGPKTNGKGRTFSDVNALTPHHTDISWLAKAGVTTGYGDGTFGGMRTVVRQDMAAFLHRMRR